MFEQDPKAALEAGRNEDGEIVLEDTGDPLIDKWEKELAMGLTPDLTEGLSDTERQKLERERARASRVRQRVQDIGEINETFGLPDPHMESKFVSPGSDAEAQLLAERALRKAEAAFAARRDVRKLDPRDLLGHGVKER